MRIGLDTVCLVPPFTGIPNYVLHLLTAMLDAASAHTFVGFHGLRWHDVDRAYVEGLRPLQSDAATPPTLNAMTQARRFASRHPRIHATASGLRGRLFTHSLLGQRIDMYHAFMSRAPGRTMDIPVIPVIYDLSYVRFPELHPRARVNWLAPVTELCRVAPMIHTISAAVRDEIVASFGRTPEDVAVIQTGINQVYRTATLPDTDILQRLDIRSGRFALSVSTLEPRKNFKTLLAAYRAMTRAQREQMPLVLVGAGGWGDTDMSVSLDALKAEGTLRLAGYVSDFDLRTLYGHARTMFYPSLYEGYGMPITEALASGCPVVVSDTSSMPEAACGQGRKVAPLDVDAWLGELRRAATDDGAQEAANRAKLREAVAHLTWAAAATKTFALYDAVAARTRGPV